MENRSINMLRSGAVWGICVTGSPLSPERASAGIDALKSLGFGVKCPLDPSKYYGRYEHGFSNGSVEERRAAVHSLLEDPEVDVLLSSRGGYGAIELLPVLDFTLFEKHSKPIIGCSDLTLILPQPGVWGVHGPTLGSSFADYSQQAAARQSIEALIKHLSEPTTTSYSCRELRSGRGEGWVLAGNLSVLTSLLGTPWDIDYRGAVLVVEDVGEPPYRVHRSLLQLKLSGKLDNLAGLVFGRFARCEAAHGPTVDEVIKLALDAILAGSNFPVYDGLEMGHWGLNLPLSERSPAIVEDGCLIVNSSERQWKPMR